MNLRELSTQMHMGMPSEAPAAGKAAPKKKSKGGAASHLKKAHAAHKAGDHKSAKSHAFGFIRALPKQHEQAPQPLQGAAPVSAPVAGGI